MSEPAGTARDSHYRLCKKVAQLTKVVVQLNTANEAFANEKERLVAEIKSKEDALERVVTSSKAKEDEAQKRLITAQNDASQRIEELESKHDREKASHSATSRSLHKVTQSLEEQSRQHQQNILCLRNELTEEHKNRAAALQEEMRGSHEEEIKLLKTRHEQTLRRVNEDAADQERSAVENAVATTRLEYEKRLSEHSACYRERREEAKVLREELETAKARADEVSGLRSELDARVCNEQKLQAEVKRLQASLDAMSISNQKIITELQRNNSELVGDLNKAQGDLERIKTLEVENDELKCLLDTLDKNKSCLETGLKSLSTQRDEERKSYLMQAEDDKERIQSLQMELDNATSMNTALTEQLGGAISQVSKLSQYKEYVERVIPSLHSIRTGMDQCKAEHGELIRLFEEAVEKIRMWENKMTALHTEERSRLMADSDRLTDECEKLRTAVQVHEAAKAEARTTITSLEKKVQYMEDNAKSVSVARTGERLAWEAAMEDLKKQHKKSQARLACLAQDEQDILGNQIAMLQEESERERERHERKCQLLAADWQQKVEDQKGTTSRIKYESALEIQGLSMKMAAGSEKLVSKESECKSLMQSIDSMREQQELAEEEAESRHEETCNRYRQELVALKQSYDAQVHQKDEELERIERERDTAADIAEQKMEDLRNSIAAERSNMRARLRDVKSQLDDLRVAFENTKHEWDHCTSAICNEVSANQQRIKQSLDALVERHSDEMEQLRIAHSEREGQLSRQIEATAKEAKNAKAMLFNTIRESEAKLKKTTRQLREDHEVKMKALVDDHNLQCDVLTEKMSALSKDYESLARANAGKVDAIIQKDKELIQLKEKMSDTVKAHDEELVSLRVQHEDERKNIVKEVQNRETTALKEKHAWETSVLQSTIDAVNKQLVLAQERWDSRPSLQEDEERIKSLQHELTTLSLREEESRAKMDYFKRELENRETNYNTRFAAGAAPLRVNLQDNAKPSTKQARQGSTTRRKVRGKVGAGTRKKKTATSSKLPKIAK